MDSYHATYNEWGNALRTLSDTFCVMPTIIDAKMIQTQIKAR